MLGGLRRLATRAIIARPGPLSVPVRLILVAEVIVAYLRTARHLGVRDLRRLLDQQVRVLPREGAVQRLNRAQASRVAMQLGWVVSRTMTFLPTDSRCLAQSLVLLHLLSARGIDGHLIIGAKTGPVFEAHAWIEHDGRPVLPELGFDEVRLIEL